MRFATWLPRWQSLLQTLTTTTRSLPRLLSKPQLPRMAQNDLIKQINQNHEILLKRLSAIESAIALQKKIDNANVTTRKTDFLNAAEVEEERHRLVDENQKLKAGIVELTKKLTELEVAVKGADQVAPIEMIKKSARLAAKKNVSKVEVVKEELPAKSPPKENISKAKESKLSPAESKAKSSGVSKEGKSEGKAKQPKQQNKQESEPVQIDASRLDLRVGRIIDVKKHPDADSLYVEQIECGEEKPRTVVSGLVKFVPIEEMQNRLVVILCNLKPAKMRGVTSEAMVMCASTPDKVEVLSPPEDAVPGDRVTFEKYPGTPDTQLNPKKKIWEQIAPDLSTNEQLMATYKGDPFVVPGKGPVKSATLKNVAVK